MSARTQLLARLVLRVAVDGVDGAGKTTFADELAGVLGQRGRQVLRASADGFHRPRGERSRRGRHTPEGVYRDSCDPVALRRKLLDPPSAGDTLRYRTAVSD